MSDSDSDNDDKNDKKDVSLDPFEGMGKRAAEAADAMIAEQRAKIEEQQDNN